jgi:hypothetical protein
MGTPTRYTYGIATVPKTEPLGHYPLPDPFHTSATSNSLGSVTYSNDFDTLIGTDYTVTGTSSTFALGAGLGGVAVLTPGAATTASSAYKNGQFLQFTSGLKFWYMARFNVSALGGTAYIGLQAGSSTSDGIWFAVSSTGAVSLVSVVGGTTTTIVPSTAFTTATAGGWVDVAFYYDGTDLMVFQSDVTVARVTAPTIGASATTLTNAIIGPVFEMTPTASQTMTVDYVLAAEELYR